MSIADPLWGHIDRSWQHGAGTVLAGRCEIFGNHDAGPRHMQGGRFGPEYNGPIHWACPEPAIMRVRMHCPYGHHGPVMNICEGHARQCGAGGYGQGRFAGRCTACAQPAEQIALEEQYYDTGYRFENARRAGDYEFAQALAVKLADIGQAMGELAARGIVRSVPLRCEEIA